MLYISCGVLRVEKLKISFSFNSSASRKEPENLNWVWISKYWGLLYLLCLHLTVLFSTITCSIILGSISCCAFLIEYHPITKTKPKNHYTVIDYFLFLSSTPFKPNDKNCLWMLDIPVSIPWKRKEKYKIRSRSHGNLFCKIVPTTRSHMSFTNDIFWNNLRYSKIWIYIFLISSMVYALESHLKFFEFCMIVQFWYHILCSC